MKFTHSAKFLLFAAMFVVSVLTGFSQNRPQPQKPTAPVEDLRPIKSSPAYAELLLRDTELRADLESLLIDYTDEYPKVKEIKSELELLRSELDRLNGLKPTDAPKLTTALGKLMLGKVQHQTKLRQLRVQYADEHPNVRRQRKIVEVYETAIKEILN